MKLVGASSIVVKFAAVAACLMAAAVMADETISADVTLSADADWRAKGMVTIAEGVTVSLNGHNLSIAGLAGAGRIIDSKYSGGYTRLTYIQSTGSQYIDTGYIHDTTTKVDLRISFTSVGEQWQSFYGARNSRADTAKGFSMWLNYAKFRRAFGAAAANIDSLTVNTTTVYDLHLDKGGESTVTPGEGEPVSLGTATAGAALTWTDFLFAINQDPGANGKAPAFISRAKIYFCRIYSGDTLVRNMVPVRREADGALGMLDLVNDATFYPNNGSGTFVAGEDVDESGHLRLATSDDASYDLSSLSVAAKCVAVGGVVAKDTDWSSLPLLSVEAGTVLDLAGHDLRVPALVGVFLSAQHDREERGDGGTVGGNRRQPCLRSRTMGRMATLQHRRRRRARLGDGGYDLRRTVGRLRSVAPDGALLSINEAHADSPDRPERRGVLRKKLGP